MEGHWGQKVAIVPSKKAVVVRLGWTFDSDQFDYCSIFTDSWQPFRPPKGTSEHGAPGAPDEQECAAATRW